MKAHGAMRPGVCDRCGQDVDIRCIIEARDGEPVERVCRWCCDRCAAGLVRDEIRVGTA